jgi:elongation factor 3
MPHQVSPPMAPAIMVGKVQGTAATPEEIAASLNTVFNEKTSQACLDASYALTAQLLATSGFRGLEGHGVLEEIKKAATDKKSGTRRESSMILLGALFEGYPTAQPISEVIFLSKEYGLLPLALDLLADKGSVVRESAQYAIDALFKLLKPEAMVVGLLPVLSVYLGKRSGKWQGTVGALELIGRMADKAKVGMGSAEEEKNKDILREAMGTRLAGLIPIVEGGMHDLKGEVSSP